MNKNQLLIQGGVLVAGTGIGFGAGYFVFKKKFERIAEEEIASVRDAYAKNAMVKPDLGTLAARKVENQRRKDELNINAVEPTHLSVISEQGYASDNETTDSDAFRATHGRVPSTYELIQMGKGVGVEEAVRNLNDHDDSGLREGNIFDDIPYQDPEELGEGVDELPPRSLDRPYVIEVSEWYLNETNFDQITLTYWADDDVLVDDAGRVIHEVEAVTGATNLHRFGFKSESPDLVYVRNERLKVDYEITKDDRNYSEVVHGIELDEGKVNGQPRRMRSNDE